MRKSVILLSILLIPTLLLSACGFVEAVGSVINPASASTTVNPSLLGHDDDDNDGICDNCDGTFVNSQCMGYVCAKTGEHVRSEYKSNEYVHWREYICGHPWEETVEEHVDKNGNSICDFCGYEMDMDR